MVQSGLKLGIEFNRLGMKQGKIFCSFDTGSGAKYCCFFLFFNLLRRAFQILNRTGKITFFVLK